MRLGCTSFACLVASFFGIFFSGRLHFYEDPSCCSFDSHFVSDLADQKDEVRSRVRDKIKVAPALDRLCNQLPGSLNAADLLTFCMNLCMILCWTLHLEDVCVMEVLFHRFLALECHNR